MLLRAGPFLCHHYCAFLKCVICGYLCFSCLRGLDQGIECGDLISPYEDAKKTKGIVFFSFCQIVPANRQIIKKLSLYDTGNFHVLALLIKSSHLQHGWPIPVL